MSKPYRAQLRNGNVIRHIESQSPQGGAAGTRRSGTLIVNCFLGDSNAVGWGAPYDAARHNIWGAPLINATTGVVERNIAHHNWDNDTTKTSLALTVGGRNEALATFGFNGVDPDFGFRAGGLAGSYLSADWSLAAHLTEQRYIPATPAPGGFLQASNGNFVHWLKMANSGATFAEGGVSGFHPDSTNTPPVMFGNLRENVTGMKATWDFSTLLYDTIIFDTIYLVLGSVDADATYPEAAYNVTGNAVRLVEELTREFDLPYAPAVVLMEPIAGDVVSYSETSTAIVRRNLGQEKLPPNWRVVASNDLPRQGDSVHFTADGLWTLGQRMARARMDMAMPALEVIR